MNIIFDLEPDYKKNDYDQVYHDFISLFAEYSYIKAIGKFGENSEPGISDLDLLVIVEDDYLEKIYKEINIWRNQTKIRRFVFAHDILVVPVALISDLSLLHTVKNLKWGYESIEGVSSAAPSIEYITIVWASFLLPIAVKYLYSNNTLSLRSILLTLKNIHYSCELVSNLLNDPIGKIGDSYEMRKSIIKNNDNKIYGVLYEEYKNSCCILMNLLDKYCDFVIEDETINEQKKHRKMYLLRSGIYIFSNIRNNINIHNRRFIRININHKLLMLLMPGNRKKSDNPLFLTKNIYYNAARHAAYFYKKYNVPYQFISSFGYPVYKTLIYRSFWGVKHFFNND